MEGRPAEAVREELSAQPQCVRVGASGNTCTSGKALNCRHARRLPAAGGPQAAMLRHAGPELKLPPPLGGPGPGHPELAPGPQPGWGPEGGQQPGGSCPHLEAPLQAVAWPRGAGVTCLRGQVRGSKPTCREPWAEPGRRAELLPLRASSESPPPQRVFGKDEVCWAHLSRRGPPHDSGVPGGPTVSQGGGLAACEGFMHHLEGPSRSRVAETLCPPEDSQGAEGWASRPETGAPGRHGGSGGGRHRLRAPPAGPGTGW